MDFRLVMLIQVVVIAIESAIFSYAISASIESFLKKISTTDEKQKQRAIQWLVFSILFMLSIYVYTVRFVFFR